VKNSLKFAAGLILVAGALVASGNAAQAGEGGAAGSVSILFNAPTPAAGNAPAIDNVARLSSSVAVGKGFAAATSLTVVGNGTNGTTATSAVGAGGGFSLLNANNAAAVYSATAETTTTVGQANSFAGGTPASLRPITGVTLP
jgi:hypothetical protein